MESNSSVIARYHSFHDWYLCSVSTDMFDSVVELRLMFDNRKDRVRVTFKGATRCLVKDFLIQNIIYSIDILSDFESKEFIQARSDLDASYPWGKDKAPKPIASISASIGAELLIEFDSVEVDSE
ncbi:hypothetical protein [Paraburkholderia bannensis]|uniref:hypothetical protein n=1 Tax=Paraburkholderia bannensis TaxID=765414 RepID=UPI002AB71199|nr:hypothetical protein [Paraburkholderia bannensis]